MSDQLNTQLQPITSIEYLDRIHFQIDRINAEATDLEQGYGGEKKEEINNTKVSSNRPSIRAQITYSERGK